MTAHPDFEALADLADGRRIPAARAAASHAASCAACGEAVERLRGMTEALAAGAGAEPPAGAIRRALRVPLRARLAGAVEAAREIVARLVFDSLAAPAPAALPALRGAAPSQRLYRAGPWEIEILRTAGEIRGSVVPVEDPGSPAPPLEGRAVLLRGRRVVATADLDARGRFAFEGVPKGVRTLRISLGPSDLVLHDLDL